VSERIVIERRARAVTRRWTISAVQAGERKVWSVRHSETGARIALRNARRKAALYGFVDVRCDPPLEATP
jgi:hypothetical protein